MDGTVSRHAAYGRLAADPDGETTADAFGSEGSDAGAETGDGAFITELAAGVCTVGVGVFDGFLSHAASATARTSPGAQKRVKTRGC